jgi:cell division protein FtsI (penicillin-binding protein 3)
MTTSATATSFNGGRRRRAGGTDPVLALAGLVALAFLAVGLQTLRLALLGAPGGPRMQLAEPLVRIYSRPDIVDRKGQLLATDLQFHSLFADPALVIDPDEASEKLAEVLPDLSQRDLRATLADRSRRFVWIRRGLPPATAQRIHDLGLPGLAFRTEPRRVYPQGRLAGHVLGGVSIDNRGLSGLEKHIDEALGLETGYSSDFSRPPVTLTLDLGAQHGLDEELSLALAQYGASGAAGVIMDAATGAVLAASTLPDVDPGRPGEALLADRIDRLAAGTFELGSVLKIFTVAMALEDRIATPATVMDVRAPLEIGRWTIRDLVPSGRPLTMREVLVQSSNIGVAQLALRAGAQRQRAFLARLGLTEPMRWEAGALGTPRLPARWGEIEVATISYGHGIAVSPLQLVAASAPIFNGGMRVRPHTVETLPGIVPVASAAERVLSEQTSVQMREMLRRAVTGVNGTGRRAEVAGFEVGGKTGTAEMAVRGGYEARSVVASFLGAFPISAPRYLVLVTLIEPRHDASAGGRITAGVNAAPIAARVIARTGPLLGVVPR